MFAGQALLQRVLGDSEARAGGAVQVGGAGRSDEGRRVQPQAVGPSACGASCAINQIDLSQAAGTAASPRCRCAAQLQSCIVGEKDTKFAFGQLLALATQSSRVAILGFGGGGGQDGPGQM